MDREIGMKIQCNACEAAEAVVMCCADEAALCCACDQKVHAANKLAGKHQRVSLLSPSSASHTSPRVPKCDICQEASGYFFCLEDRALLCRKCDLGIHTANSYVSTHQRFLVSGVQVGLEPMEPVASFDKEQPNSARRVPESTCKSLPKGNTSMLFSSETNQAFSSQAGTNGDLVGNKASVSGSTMFGSISDWPFDEFFGFPDLNKNYGFTEQGSSKADSGKIGSSEGSPSYYSVNEGLDADECLGQVPEISRTVSEVPSPPTASGLHWQRNLHYPAAENARFVPDVCSPYLSLQFQVRAASPKHRRPC